LPGITTGLFNETLSIPGTTKINTKMKPQKPLDLIPTIPLIRLLKTAAVLIKVHFALLLS